MKTKQEQIEFIKQKCVEADPSIMDLVTGCEVIYQNKEGYIVATGRTETKKAMFVCFNESPDERNTCIIEDEDFEIIGRPITLADVLIAVWKTDRLIVVRGDGLLYLEDDGPQRPFVYWSLLRPIEEQSEEVITMFANLLK